MAINEECGMYHKGGGVVVRNSLLGTIAMIVCEIAHL